MPTMTLEQFRFCCLILDFVVRHAGLFGAIATLNSRKFRR